MVDVAAPKTTTMDGIHASSIVSAVVDNTDLKLKNRAGTLVASLTIRNNASNFAKSIVRLGGARFGYRDVFIKRWHDRRRANKQLLSISSTFFQDEVKFSPDGMNLVHNYNGTPKNLVQYWITGSPRNVLDMAGQSSPSLPDSNTSPKGISFSPDSQYMAFGTARSFENPTATHILICKRDPTRGTDPDGGFSGPDGQADQYFSIYPLIGVDDQALGNSIFMETAWHPDGLHLTGVANNADVLHPDMDPDDILAAPWIYTYKRIGDTFSLLGSPSILPEKPNTLSYSPDGKYLIVGTSGVPSKFLVGYLCIDDDLVPFDLVDQPPTSIGGVTRVRFSPDSQRLAIGTVTAPYLQIYKKVGNRFVLDPGTITLPSSQVNDLDWSPDGRYLAVGANITPSFYVYFLQDDGNWFKVADPETLPSAAGAIRSLSWSPDGLYLAVCTSDSAIKILGSALAPVPGAAVQAFED